MPLINNYTHYTNRGIVYIYTKQVPTYITTSKTNREGKIIVHSQTKMQKK